MTDKRLSVCMVSHDFYPDQIGGQGIYAYEVCRGLAELGHDVHAIVAPTPERIAHYQAHPEFPISFAKGKNPVLFSWYAHRLFKQVYGHMQFDILHGNELFAFMFAMRRPKNVAKLLLISHNSYLERQRACVSPWKRILYVPPILAERISYRRADAMIVGAEMEYEVVTEQYGIEPSKVNTVYYGTHPERYAPLPQEERADLRRTLGIGEDEPTVLFVGRMVERKKPHVLVEAMKDVVEHDPRIHCILVGDGGYRDRIEQTVRQQGLVHNVHLVGAVPYDSLHHYYSSADMFVLPSQGEGGVSLVLLEAAASGLPLIVTRDASSHCPILQDGLNGYIVECTREDIRDKILATAVQASSMGSESRRIVSEFFTWNRCISKTLEVYRG